MPPHSRKIVDGDRGDLGDAPAKSRRTTVQPPLKRARLRAQPTTKSRPGQHHSGHSQSAEMQPARVQPESFTSGSGRTRDADGLQSAVAALDSATVQKILLDAAKNSRLIRDAIRVEREMELQADDTFVMRFSGEAKRLESIWEKCGSTSSSDADYDDQFDPPNEILSLVRSIERKVEVDSPYFTKYHALKALWSIGSQVIEAPVLESRLTREVRERFSNDVAVGRAMCHVLKTMDAGEKDRLMMEERHSLIADLRTLTEDAYNNEMPMDLAEVEMELPHSYDSDSDM